MAPRHPMTWRTEALRRSDRYLLAYPPLLFASWIVAWIIDIALRARFHWDTQADTIYWIAMKAIVWVLPVLLAIRLVERASITQFLELGHTRRGVLWGCALGAALIAVTFLGKTLPSGTSLRVPSLSLALLNAVIVAPLVEEITLRGFVLKRLELNGRSFWIANALTTLVFVVMHLPGWFFQGHVTSMAGLAQRIAPLTMMSLLFGWSKKRSESLYGAIAPHAINNFYSALLP